MSAFAGRDDIAHAWGVAADDYVRQFFDELDRKPFDREFLDRYAFAVAGREPVVDMGCGPGHIARYLAERGVEVFGVDLSPGMIETARAMNPDLRFEVGDMTALDAGDRSWAGIVAFYSLVNLPATEVPVALAEFRRVLRDDGLLAYAVHGGEGEIHRDEWDGEPVRLSFSLFALDDLVAWTERAGFVIEEAISRPPYPDEHPTQRLYVRARVGAPGRLP